VSAPAQVSQLPPTAALTSAPEITPTEQITPAQPTRAPDPLTRILQAEDARAAAALSALRAQVLQGELSADEALTATLTLALTSALGLSEASATTLTPRLRALSALEPHLLERVSEALKQQGR
jgi:hypothetical protein